MLLSVPRPDQLRALHIGGYWRGPNDIVMHMMRGLAATGADVLEFSTDDNRVALDTEGRWYDRGTSGPTWLREAALRDTIDRFDPHLVVCNAGGLAFRPETAAVLRQRRCLLGIALSDPDVFERTTRHIAATFDLFLTNAPRCVPDYRALGVRTGVLPVATNPDFFRPVPGRSEYDCDVLVLGRAHPDRVEPVRALVAAFDTHVHGEGWEEHGIPSRGLVFGEDALAALSSARCTVVFNLTADGHALVKVGLFDFTAAGALVVTNRSPLIEPYFAIGREVVAFDGTGDLLAKIAELLRDPATARSIRDAGRQRTLRDHTWAAVWRDVLQWAAGERGTVR